ncbi:DUF4809 family protein [Enterococcus asini]|uniref:DUF4809 family protein n=1 Tax=Enterococcus TaxID=1350 RepID=UPI0028904527|nr:DUF4809 family protein [Enterococcus asini]MDT2757179.1 DUF4809 family protein [Enterococcus asini]
MNAIISGKKRIAEGGCNACESFALHVFRLTFEDGNEVSLENLDVPSLVMAFAQKDHWKQAFTMLGMDEEAMVYKKEGQEIINQETSHSVSYQKGNEKVTADKKYCDMEDLYRHTNEILALFGIEAVSFEYQLIEPQPLYQD